MKNKREEKIFLDNMDSKNALELLINAQTFEEL